MAVVMEILSGENLFDWMCDQHAPLPENSAKNIIYQLLSALEHLHARHVSFQRIFNENLDFSVKFFEIYLEKLYVPENLSKNFDFCNTNYDFC